MGYYSHLTKEQRIASYDFIETFISQNVTDWRKWNNEIGTDDIEQLFRKTLQSMSKPDFEFLTLHCGYIPDYYGKDSSQETLYSKLVESLVCEWAVRIGFTDSFLQKQKSNKEDVTILRGRDVIVCDAKSFRLGRSQAAPNVKDTIKKEAYSKWLSEYVGGIGGLTTFPSLHNWKKGGAAYMYYTEGNPPIMILFYEHLAYILNQGISADSIISFLRSYPRTYPKASEDQSVYWRGVKDVLFGNNANYDEYMEEAAKYTSEKATHTLTNIQNRLRQIETDVDAQLSSMSVEELQKIARLSLIENRGKELSEQVKHIKEFRPVSDGESTLFD